MYGNLGFTQIALNDTGDIAFAGSVDGGGVGSGLFTAPAVGADVAVALEGDAAPGTAGGSYGSFAGNSQALDMNAAGDVVFASAVTGSDLTSAGIFVDSGGVDTAVALPMAGSGDSLNVATTAAVLLYEAVRQRRAPTTKED